MQRSANTHTVPPLNSWEPSAIDPGTLSGHDFCLLPAGSGFSVARNSRAVPVTSNIMAASREALNYATARPPPREERLSED